SRTGAASAIASKARSTPRPPIAARPATTRSSATASSARCPAWPACCAERAFPAPPRDFQSMSTYSAPLRDIRFALYDVLCVEATFRQLRFDDANRETVDAVLDESARFCNTVLAPLNKVGDEHGVAYD